jgi:hypothetical protein
MKQGACFEPVFAQYTDDWRFNLLFDHVQYQRKRVQINDGCADGENP